MYIIPQGVQITSIENTVGSEIVINAQSATYEQLGYLKSKIKEDGILLDVQSDSGQKQSSTSIARITIEGDLPYTWSRNSLCFWNKRQEWWIRCWASKFDNINKCWQT